MIDKTDLLWLQNKPLSRAALFYRIGGVIRRITLEKIVILTDIVILTGYRHSEWTSVSELNSIVILTG